MRYCGLLQGDHRLGVTRQDRTGMTAQAWGPKLGGHVLARRDSNSEEDIVNFVLLSGRGSTGERALFAQARGDELRIFLEPKHLENLGIHKVTVYPEPGREPRTIQSDLEEDR